LVSWWTTDEFCIVLPETAFCEHLFLIDFGTGGNDAEFIKVTPYHDINSIVVPTMGFVDGINFALTYTQPGYAARFAWKSNWASVHSYTTTAFMRLESRTQYKTGVALAIGKNNHGIMMGYFPLTNTIQQVFCNFGYGSGATVLRQTVALHTWILVGCTYDDVIKVAKLYINGKLNQTLSTPTHVSAMPAGNDGYVGSTVQNSTTYSYINALSDVRLYNKALSADSMLTMYENQFYVHCGAPFFHGKRSVIHNGKRSVVEPHVQQRVNAAGGRLPASTAAVAMVAAVVAVSVLVAFVIVRVRSRTTGGSGSTTTAI